MTNIPLSIVLEGEKKQKLPLTGFGLVSPDDEVLGPLRQSDHMNHHHHHHKQPPMSTNKPPTSPSKPPVSPHKRPTSISAAVVLEEKKKAGLSALLNGESKAKLGRRHDAESISGGTVGTLDSLEAQKKQVAVSKGATKRGGKRGGDPPAEAKADLGSMLVQINHASPVGKVPMDQATAVFTVDSREMRPSPKKVDHHQPAPSGGSTEAHPPGVPRGGRRPAPRKGQRRPGGVRRRSTEEGGSSSEEFVADFEGSFNNSKEFQMSSRSLNDHDGSDDEPQIEEFKSGSFRKQKSVTDSHEFPGKFPSTRSTDDAGFPVAEFPTEFSVGAFGGGQFAKHSKNEFQVDFSAR